MEKDVCPLCGNKNSCGMELSRTAQSVDSQGAEAKEVTSTFSCWCMDETREKLPENYQSLLPEEFRGNVCLCQACISKLISRTKSGDSK